MKRRDLIKSGLIVAGISAIGISAKKNSIDIVPKQTDVYKISRPMPFDLKKIDEIVEQNKKAKKYQIKTLYNSIPEPLCSMFAGEFQSCRGENKNIKSFEDFAKFATYTMKNGFDFVYTLNSPKPFLEDAFYNNKKLLFDLLDNLQAIGCKDLKIANQQLMEVINREKHFNFDFHVSTSSEYHNVQQYTTLIKTYPNIKSINISIDDNRNFHLLRSLRKLFPDVDLEILVNETCLHGCPSRMIHPSTWFCYFDCYGLENKIGAFEFFFKSNMIYPWQLAYYSAIGINSFKIMLYTRGAEQNTEAINSYLKGIENGTKDMSAEEFFYGVMGMRKWVKLNPDIKLSEIMPYLPDIRHFVKNGYKCGSICGSECNYCMDCCKKIKEIMLVS
ncbi:MAG: hypothetical protein K6C94_02480 [Candidatus Gastranaerophilales bacterium]|nr:hypothetical protein [Candidatus Gastranaerophilales bacterium]